jgi:hypothetical protein
MYDPGVWEELAMKALIIGGLCAALGVAAAPCFAEEPPRRAVGSFQRVAPAANAVANPAAAPAASPSVSLSRPVPVGAGVAGADVAPASYTPAPSTTLDRPTPLFRAKAPELDASHQLMPIGPSGTVTRPGTVKPMSQARETPAPMPIFTGAQPEKLQAPRSSARSVPYATQTPFLDTCYPTGPVECYPAAPGDCYVTEEICCEPCGPFGGRFRSWIGCFDACGMDGCCMPRPRRWVRAEYLLWHISNPDMPPLLTTENFPLRPINGGAGTLPQSPIVFDPSEEIRSGFRGQFGFWFPWREQWGLDFGGFMLVRRNNDFEGSSDALGNPVLARPFFDAALGVENAQIVSYPGEFAGTFTFDSVTKLWGAEVNLRRKLACGPRWWLDGFAGWRHITLNDAITLQETIMDISPGPGDVLGFGVRDTFETRNQFNGLQLGIEGEVRLLRRWFVAGSFKFAMGNMHQTLEIDGFTDFMLPGGGRARGVGGLFALRSNIGRFERNEFAVVPEFGIKLGFDVTDHLRVYAGYNVLCLSDVLRAGEQIDRTINPNMLPDIATPPGLNPPLVAPARPAVLFRDSTFWAGGAQFGLEYHW